jgi:hypothetical protein
MVLSLIVSVPWLLMAPPTVAALLERTLLITVSVPLLKIAPPLELFPLVIVSPERLTTDPELTVKMLLTVDELWPEMVSRFAPGPLRFNESAMAGSAVPSVIVCALANAVASK